MNESRASAATARVIVWIGGAWVGLVVAVLVLAAAAALSKLMTGDPEWEGVVMLPIASVFGAVVASPGALLLVVDWCSAAAPSATPPARSNLR
jgi:hypothetical protein